jgi:hypothetical protein
VKKRLSLDVAVNVLLAVACVVVIASNVRGWWGRAYSPQQAIAEKVRPGIRIPGLDGVEWGERNILLFARSSCRHCTESMPFYQKLSALAHQSGARFVVASEEPHQTIETYFRSHDVAPDEVVTASPQKTGVPLTPTLAVVDRSGTVLESWVGRVPPDGEPKVVALVSRQ